MHDYSFSNKYKYIYNKMIPQKQMLIRMTVPDATVVLPTVQEQQSVYGELAKRFNCNRLMGVCQQDQGGKYRHDE